MCYKGPSAIVRRQPMKSDDQNLRDMMTREIRAIRPLFAAGVESEARMQQYHTDFHTRSIRQMRNYQDKHKVVFCKACPERKKYGRRIYRQLCFHFEADLLGNIERVINAECYKCGFNMLLPAEKQDFAASKVDEFEWNRVRGMFNEVHLEYGVPLDTIFHALQNCARDYELRYGGPNMTAREVYERTKQMQRQQDHMTDAMRYASQQFMTDLPYPLSSARTAQTKKKTK